MINKVVLFIYKLRYSVTIKEKGGDIKVKRGEKLTNFIDSRNLTVSSLARESGVAYTTIRSMIEKDLVNSSVDNVIKICRVLGISVEELLEDKKVKNTVNHARTDYIYIPMPVSAGLPIKIDSIEDAETISIPDELLGNHAGDEEIFFMRVNGDSMNKVMPHKSLIGIKPIKIKDLKNEDIVVYSDGYDYSVKRFYQDGDRILFRPESHDNFFIDYSTTIDNEDIRIHGRVVTYLVNLD